MLNTTASKLFPSTLPDWRFQRIWRGVWICPLSTILSIDIDNLSAKFAALNNSNRMTYEFEYKMRDAPDLIRFSQFFYTLNIKLRIRDDKTEEFADDSLDSESMDSGLLHVEHNTPSLANQFLWASLNTIEEHLQARAWFPPTYEIATMSVRRGTIADFNRSQQKMKVILGRKKVIARTDGGVVIYPTVSLRDYYSALSVDVLNSLCSKTLIVSVNGRNTVYAQ